MRCVGNSLVSACWMSESLRHQRHPPNAELSTHDPNAFGGWIYSRTLIRRINDRDAKVAVVRQGYVGLPLAMRAAELGFRFVGYDVNADRTRARNPANE